MESGKPGARAASTPVPGAARGGRRGLSGLLARTPMRLLLALALVLSVLTGTLWIDPGRRAPRAVAAETREEPPAAPPVNRTPPVLGGLEPKLDAARAPDAPPEMPRSTVRGRVLRADRSPAAGASVVLECSAPFRSALA